MSDEIDQDPIDSRKHERARWERRSMVLVPAFVLVGLLAWGLMAPGEPTQRDAPDFQLAALDGGTISSAELKGRPIVLNFWASWCIPCREEMPAFQRMWTRYRDQGVQIIGVNVQDSEKAAREFVDEIGVTYPIALDTEENLANELGVRGLPQTFFIDENFRFERISAGEAVDGGGDRVVFGAIDEETLERKIQELLQDD